MRYAMAEKKPRAGEILVVGRHVEMAVTGQVEEQCLCLAASLQRSASGRIGGGHWMNGPTSRSPKPLSLASRNGPDTSQYM